MKKKYVALLLALALLATSLVALAAAEKVWIPTKGGKKYHSRSKCSQMINPRQVTLEEAKALKFTACKRCK